jgi:proton-dependent oligopeptide transporter, POT family
MSKRSVFPPVFWIANTVEILERFAYYGIYMGFGIYMDYLGYSKGELGLVQSIFLFVSYIIPIFSGTLADRYGFKKMLLVSYLAYLPSILLLIFTKSYFGIVLSMMSIGFAAGIFKPLVAGTVRSVTDRTNKTLGFGVYYTMINIGATLGPVIAGNLRAISWNAAFIANAIAIGVMFFVTLFFYKEPPRDIAIVSVKDKFKEIVVVLSDRKFAIFLLLMGVFYWLPLWSFINILAGYVDKSVDTASLYVSIKNLFGSNFAGFLSHTDEHGVHRILGETISSTGYMIIIFQLVVSRTSERFKAIPSFLVGMGFAAFGFIFLALARTNNPAFVFLGIFLFAVGEMTISPRVQEYVTWLAPKEKAGLYIGANYLAMGLGGALSGVTYTWLSGWFIKIGHPNYIWNILAVHLVLGGVAIFIFIRTLGEFKEMEA